MIHGNTLLLDREHELYAICPSCKTQIIDIKHHKGAKCDANGEVIETGVYCICPVCTETEPFPLTVSRNGALISNLYKVVDHRPFWSLDDEAIAAVMAGLVILFYGVK